MDGVCTAAYRMGVHISPAPAYLHTGSAGIPYHLFDETVRPEGSPVEKGVLCDLPGTYGNLWGSPVAPLYLITGAEDRKFNKFFMLYPC